MNEVSLCIGLGFEILKRLNLGTTLVTQLVNSPTANNTTMITRELKARENSSWEKVACVSIGKHLVAKRL